MYILAIWIQHVGFLLSANNHIRTEFYVQSTIEYAPSGRGRAGVLLLWVIEEGAEDLQ